MKKYGFLLLLAVLSMVNVNAQCITYSCHSFHVEDFIVDSDTLGYDVNTLAYYYVEEDTTSAKMRVSFVRSEDAKNPQQKQVFVMKKQESMREIQSQRVAFFTAEMSLTPEEAQVFWPLYNQYSEKKSKLAGEQKKLMKSFSKEGISAMTAKEAEEAASAFIRLQKQESDLDQEYHKKFMNQLPTKKVLQMYKAEKDFMQNLLWHLKGDRKKGKD